MQKNDERVGLREAVEILQRYQDWRTGKDERHLNDTGLTPAKITVAINTILEYLHEEQ